MEALERPPWNPSRQCTATARAGERCRRQPIPGGTVCVNHGGAIPAVQATAKLRLLAMVEPILTVWEEILDAWHRTACTGCGHVDEHGNVCRGCGKPTGDPAPVIRIGQLVLDRAGFHPTLAIQQVAPPNEFADLSEDELISALEAMLTEAKASRDLKQQPVIDVSTDYYEVPDTYDTQSSDAIQPEDVQIPVGNGTHE